MFDADKKGSTARPTLDDTLEYMADMLLALEDMARRNELQTLAGIIDLAHGEARQQAKKAK